MGIGRRATGPNIWTRSLDLDWMEMPGLVPDGQIRTDGTDQTKRWNTGSKGLYLHQYTWLTLKFVDPKILRSPRTPLLFENAKFQNCDRHTDPLLTLLAQLTQLT